jgi:hypothetical protein
MDILLINTNPIVSKLFKNFVEDKMIQLQEVSTIQKLNKIHYDVIFIDESLCEKHVENILQGFTSSTKVCISYALEAINGFDATLQKPFLPSQIMDILEEVSVMDREILSVLDNTEIEKIKSLLDMDNLDKIDLGIQSLEVLGTNSINSVEKIKLKKKKPKKKKKDTKSKNLNIKVKNLTKKEIKRFLQGKEITIRIQMNEESS